MHEWSDQPAKRPKTQINTVIRQKPDSKAKSAKSSKPGAKKASTKSASRAKKNVSSSPIAPEDRRRSGRARKVSVYTERADKDDEEEMLDGVAEWDYGDDSPEGSDDDAESEADE